MSSPKVYSRDEIFQQKVHGTDDLESSFVHYSDYAKLETDCLRFRDALMKISTPPPEDWLQLSAVILIGKLKDAMRIARIALVNQVSKVGLR